MTSAGPGPGGLEYGMGLVWCRGLWEGVGEWGGEVVVRLSCCWGWGSGGSRWIWRMGWGGETGEGGGGMGQGILKGGRI